MREKPHLIIITGKSPGIGAALTRALLKPRSYFGLRAALTLTLTLERYRRSLPLDAAAPSSLGDA